MKTLNDVVVERLYKFMDDDMTQYKLAQASGIPFATIKSIMQRRTKGISLKTVILLANGLGVTPSEFMDDQAFLRGKPRPRQLNQTCLLPQTVF